MLLKPSCSWCKDYGKFADVKQLRILLSCYKKLCEYIAATPIARSFVGANGESNSTLTILQEGMAINATHESSDLPQGKAINILDILTTANLGKTRDTAHLKSPGRGRGPGRPRGRSSGVLASPNSHPVRNPEVGSPVPDSCLDGLCNGLDSSDNLDMSDDHSLYSGSLSNSDSSRVKVKHKRHSSEHKSKSKKKKKKHDKDRGRKSEKQQNKRSQRSDRDRRSRIERKKRRHRYHKDSSEREDDDFREQSESEKEKLVNGNGEPSSPEEDTPKRKTVVISGHRAKLLKAGKILPPIEGCRCGTWSKHPGANTCRGNRCPCFMADKGCKKCRCRGCQNPFLEEDVTPKKRLRLSSRNEANGDSDLDIDVTNI